MYGERFRPFVVTMVTGSVLWLLSGGTVHAFVLCVDWGQLATDDATLITQNVGPFVSVLTVGLFFGLAIELAKFAGAAMRSHAAARMAPVIAGAAVGALQGALVASSWWGFHDSIGLRPMHERLLTGAITGGILAVPAILIGIWIRRSGQPW